MTALPAVDLQYTLTIPRHLAACFATPADLKAYLMAVHAWPEQVTQERWRLGIETPGWVVELTASVEVPHTAGETP